LGCCDDVFNHHSLNTFTVSNTPFSHLTQITPHTSSLHNCLFTPTPPGPASLSTDLSASYHLLAARICPSGSSRPGGGGGGVVGRERSAAETPLAKSLLAVRDPQELTSKYEGGEGRGPAGRGGAGARRQGRGGEGGGQRGEYGEGMVLRGGLGVQYSCCSVLTKRPSTPLPLLMPHALASQLTCRAVNALHWSSQGWILAPTCHITPHNDCGSCVWVVGH